MVHSGGGEVMKLKAMRIISKSGWRGVSISVQEVKARMLRVAKVWESCLSVTVKQGTMSKG